MIKKVVHVVGRLGRGGDSVAIFNVMNNMNSTEYKFDFITHAGYNEEIVRELMNKGHKVFILDGDVRILGPFRYYQQIKKVLRKNNYDAIHTHTSMQSGVALLAAKHVGIENRICHSHTAKIQRETHILQKIFFIPVLKFLLNTYSTQKVACGIDAGKYLFNHNSFQVLKNGIDLEKFNKTTVNITNLRIQNKINEDTLILGQIGRFSKIKNHEFTLNLLKRLKQKEINVICIFIGDGEEYQNILELAKKLKIDNECIFLGRKRNVHEYLKMININLLPSLPGEGFPITLVESQAANCYSIVSTNITKEANLSLNLIDYCDLSDFEQWISLIKKYPLHKKNTDIDVYKQILSLGYSNYDAVTNWIKIYEI